MKKIFGNCNVLGISALVLGIDEALYPSGAGHPPTHSLQSKAKTDIAIIEQE